MSRRYADPVEVRVGGLQIGRLPVLPAGVDASAAPTAFIWRGRLHVVQSVLDHWTQRLSWWRAPSGEDPSGQEDSAALGEDADGHRDEARERFPELEREVWRVEASAGRLMQTGIYDLTKDDRWRLVRVAD
ncbi:hypothetical protein FNH13_08730 [Ornithinimicrobium ciconiae]|uniref:DUF6504 domain-containing protein n=1 Tax=Ornithinimicrobium ciconiae TaxID=2594265 RepID=A0A516GA68_9MICO|nr:DUF6504 family protein [Ornithinimicrobium ciconiae]QDO88416.1 hypothetical protein FNH13_08730 [Ornithinimicrobium ciconiae]